MSDPQDGDSIRTRLLTDKAAPDLAGLAHAAARILETRYPGARHAVALRHAGERGWCVLSGDGAVQLPEVPSGASVSDPAEPSCFPTPSGLACVQNLGDGSHFCAALDWDGPGAIATEAGGFLLLLCRFFDARLQLLVSRRTRKDLVFSLNHRILQLNSLIDTGIEVSSLNLQNPPHQLALVRAASLTNAASGMVEVQRPDGVRDVLCFPEGGRAGRSPAAEGGIRSAFSFAGSTYSFALMDKESRNGIVPFDETDQLLLDALARQVHASLENRYLLAQALEKKAMERDLAVAASIQRRILPESLPRLPGYDLAGINIPSRSVGGDYYDCIPLSDGRVALVIADVAGKGIPAALLVSSLHAYLRGLLEEPMPMLNLVRRLNRAICASSTEDRFITLFLVLLNPETGEAEAVNAGHNPAYLLRANEAVEELDAGGLALGMMDMDFPYETGTFTLERGDGLFLYTDGVTEAADAASTLYESVRPLKEFVRRERSAGAQVFIDRLMADVQSFTGDAPQSDDITALYVIRSG